MFWSILRAPAVWLMASCRTCMQDLYLWKYCTFQSKPNLTVRPMCCVMLTSAKAATPTCVWHAGHDSDSLYMLLHHVLGPSDLDLWPMTLIFGVNPGIIRMHPCAEFHEPEFNGFDFIGLNTFDECCGKIDLFRVQNSVVRILLWWECCQAYQTEGFFMKAAWISGYFDTKYMTVLRIEQILHNFEDHKFANFFNIEQVNFCVTLVIWR